MDKTWSLWKFTFLEDHGGLQRCIQAWGDADQFGIVDAASEVAKPYRPPTGVTPEIFHKMYDYMDNMANVVTN